MKTRLLIIVGIIAVILIIGTHQSLLYQCGTLPIYMETPRNPNLWNCLEIWEKQSKHYPPPMNLSAERDAAWITNAKDELYSIGCDEPILTHLAKYSNLIDNKFNIKYGIEDIGLPDGVIQEKFEECVDFIYEKRIAELFFGEKENED